MNLPTYRVNRGYLGQNGSEIKNSICKTGLYYLVYGYFFSLNTDLTYSKEKKLHGHLFSG